MYNFRMGILEREIKTKDKRKNLQKIILSTIYAVGILSVVAVAPNIFSVIKQLEGSRSRKKSLKYSINASFISLTQIVFLKLQNSVWLYPYDCEDLISLLKADFKIGKDVLYMIVEKLENDWHLRKTFNLPYSTGRKS